MAIVKNFNWQGLDISEAYLLIIRLRYANYKYSDQNPEFTKIPEVDRPKATATFDVALYPNVEQRKLGGKPMTEFMEHCVVKPDEDILSQCYEYLKTKTEYQEGEDA